MGLVGGSPCRTPLPSLPTFSVCLFPLGRYPAGDGGTHQWVTLSLLAGDATAKATPAAKDVLNPILDPAVTLQAVRIASF